jgi:hypothetical protein
MDRNRVAESIGIVWRIRQEYSVTADEVENMVNKAGLTSHARIEKEGGLSLVVQK